MTDVQRRAIQWQGKQNRLKHVATTSGLIVLAIIATVIWQLLNHTEIRWVLALFLAAVGLDGCCLLRRVRGPLGVRRVGLTFSRWQILL